MAETGLDRSVAPDAGQCLNAARSIGASWWNVYIGGSAYLAAVGWTPDLVRSMARLGLKFMVTFVGQQAGGSLTREQGARDGADAVAAMAAFGWQNGNPCCLDLECLTYWSAPGGALDYAGAWCAAVRMAGYRPGVYSCPIGLVAVAARGGQQPDFVWLGSWLAGAPRTPPDPHHAAGLPDALWPGDGQRAWQYAGKGTLVGGLDVGVSVADPGCLAGAPELPPAAEAGVGPSDLSLSSSLADLGSYASASPSFAAAHLPHFDALPAAYVVRPGDSLASIAEANGMSWRQLWSLNRDRIANPNVIYPGRELRLTTPRLSR